MYSQINEGSKSLTCKYLISFINYLNEMFCTISFCQFVATINELN